MITTYEELDALPVGTVIRDDFDDIARRRDVHQGNCWQVLGSGRDQFGDLELSPSSAILLPVQVLWIDGHQAPSGPDRQFTDDLGRRWEWCGALKERGLGE